MTFRPSSRAPTALLAAFAHDRQGSGVATLPASMVVTAHGGLVFRKNKTSPIYAATGLRAIRYVKRIWLKEAAKGKRVGGGLMKKGKPHS